MSFARTLAVCALILAGAPRPLASVETPAIAAWPVAKAWSSDFPFGVEVSLVMGDTRLFVVESNRISARAWTDGLEVWTRDVVATMEPVADEGRLIVPTTSGLRTFSEVSGHEEWQLAVGDAVVPPTARAGWVIVATGEGALHGVSAAEGRPIWSVQLPSPLVTPVGVNGDLVVGASVDGRIRGWQITDGALRWTRELGVRPTQLLAASGSVFIGCADGQLVSLRPRDGRVNWVYRFGMPIVGRLASDLTQVYATTLDNSIHAHTFNGHQAWHQLLPSRVVDGAFADAGTVFVPQSNGEIRMYVAEHLGVRAGRLDAPKAEANVIGRLVVGGAGNQLRLALATTVGSQLALTTYRRTGLGAVPATSGPPGTPLALRRPAGRP